MLLSIDDLYAAGVGFDIAGATLLARGLLASPKALVQQTTPRVGGNPHQLVGLARDRVDATAGLTAIGAGFVVQATGYLIVVAGAGSGGFGGWATLVAGLCAVASIATTVATWKATARRRLLALLAELARHDGSHRFPSPGAHRLYTLGVAAGEQPTDSELARHGRSPDYTAYGRRVFGVEVDETNIVDALRL